MVTRLGRSADVFLEAMVAYEVVIRQVCILLRGSDGTGVNTVDIGYYQVGSDRGVDREVMCCCVRVHHI